MLPVDLDWLAVVTGILLGVGVLGAASSLLLTMEPPLSAHRWPGLVPVVPWCCSTCWQFTGGESLREDLRCPGDYPLARPCRRWRLD